MPVANPKGIRDDAAQVAREHRKWPSAGGDEKASGSAPDLISYALQDSAVA